VIPDKLDSAATALASAHERIQVLRRGTNMKFWRTGLGILAGVLFMGGSPAAAADPAESKRGVLRFGVHVSEMGKLDPHFAAGSQDRAFADMVFNGLLRYQPGNAPKIEPDLAVKIPEFEMVGGKQVWTVLLRKGVKFHAGPDTPAYELTADDVVYSLQKSANRNTCAYAGEYADLKVEKTGMYAIQIILDKPLSPILFLPKLTDYAGGFIVSKKAIETMGYDKFKQYPIGTGPFQFQRYQPGEKLILAAHDGYFRGRPKIAGVEIHFLPEIEEREAAIVNGQVDMIIGYGAKGWFDRVSKIPDMEIDTHGVGETSIVFFNTAVTPLNDVRVRRAMAYALDREAFADTTAKEFVGHVYSPVPVQYLPGGLTGEQARKLNLAYPTNLKLARQLLAEAGYPEGFTLELVSSEKRLYRRLYETLREQLDRIGITCNIAVKKHSEMHKMIRTQPIPIVIYVAWRPNADAYLTRFYHSDSIVITGSKPDTNFSRYDRIDKLIEAARLEINPEKQVNLWIQAQIRILDEMVAFPAIFTKQGYLRKDYVHYGHSLASTMALYPQFTEKTWINLNP